MHLLTWHGSVVCRADASGPLRHEAFPLPRGATPLVLAGEPPGAGVVAEYPGLGTVVMGRGERGQLLTFLQGAFFMCAEHPSRQIVFDRTEADGWEMFLPIAPPDLRDLRAILRCSWIDCATRQVARPSEIAVLTGLRLRIGDLVVDLATLPGSLVAERDAGGLPVRLQVAQDGLEAAMVIAEPRGSAFVKPSADGDASRQLAEALALVLHRHVAGLEPTQDVFDHLASMVERKGLLAGIEDVLEVLMPAAMWPKVRPGEADADTTQDGGDPSGSAEKTILDEASESLRDWWTSSVVRP